MLVSKSDYRDAVYYSTKTYTRKVFVKITSIIDFSFKSNLIVILERERE